jgi:hypothetical protein
MTHRVLAELLVLKAFTEQGTICNRSEGMQQEGWVNRADCVKNARARVVCMTFGDTELAASDNTNYCQWKQNE